MAGGAENVPGLKHTAEAMDAIACDRVVGEHSILR